MYQANAHLNLSAHMSRLSNPYLETEPMYTYTTKWQHNSVNSQTLLNWSQIDLTHLKIYQQMHQTVGTVPKLW